MLTASSTNTFFLRSRCAQFGLLCLVAPLVMYMPYRWWVYRYAQYYILTERISDHEHRAVHLGAWFAITFGMFTVSCVVVGGTLMALALLAALRRSKDKKE